MPQILAEPATLRARPKLKGTSGYLPDARPDVATSSQSDGSSYRRGC